MAEGDQKYLTSEGTEITGPDTLKYGEILIPKKIYKKNYFKNTSKVNTFACSRILLWSCTFIHEVQDK